jgi:hypothetical protein
MIRKKLWFAIHKDRQERLGPFTSQLEASKEVLDGAGYPLPGCYVWPELEIKLNANIDGNIEASLYDINIFPIDIPRKS